MRKKVVKVKNNRVAIFGLLVLSFWLTAMPVKAEETPITPESAMENFLNEAKKFNQQVNNSFNDLMGQYPVDESGKMRGWEFGEKDYDYVDPDTHKIYFSRSELIGYLEQIKKEEDQAKKAELEENLKWIYIEKILHEAGHRKALISGKAYKDNVDAEEVRNATELINRLIDILEQLNKIICGKTTSTGAGGANLFPGLTPEEAGKLFDRIKNMIEIEKAYRKKYWEGKKNENGKIEGGLKNALGIDEVVDAFINDSKKFAAKHNMFKVKTKGFKVNVILVPIVSPSMKKIDVWIDGKSIDREIPIKANPGDCPKKRKKASSNNKSFRFGFGFKATYSQARTGDFCRANTYIEEMYKECPENKVSSHCFSVSTPVQPEAFAQYTLANAHRLGLSIGYRFYPRRSSGYTVTSDYQTLAKTFDFSFFSIPLEFSYQIPVSIWNQSLFLTFGSGLDFLSGTIRLDDTAIFHDIWSKTMGKPLATGGTTYSRGKLKDSSLGGHVSVGLEYPFKANLDFTLEAGLAFGNLGGFKGTVTDQSGQKLDVVLGKEENATGYWLPLYRANAMTEQQKTASISPGGLSISLGLRYYLGKPPAPAHAEE